MARVTKRRQPCFMTPDPKADAEIIRKSIENDVIPSLIGEKVIIFEDGLDHSLTQVNELVKVMKAQAIRKKSK